MDKRGRQRFDMMMKHCDSFHMLGLIDGKPLNGLSEDESYLVLLRGMPLFLHSNWI
jgi:hypothetical protein